MAIANIENNCIYSEDVHELLGTDLKLTFENHINKLCKKTIQEFNALTRISSYMTFDERKYHQKLSSQHSLVLPSFVDVPQQKNSKKLNALHESFKNNIWEKNYSFHELLNSALIHHNSGNVEII